MLLWRSLRNECEQWYIGCDVVSEELPMWYPAVDTNEVACQTCFAPTAPAHAEALTNRPQRQVRYRFRILLLLPFLPHRRQTCHRFIAHRFCASGTCSC